MVAVAVWLLGVAIEASDASRVVDGPFEGEVRLLGDVSRGQYGDWAFTEIDGVELLLELPDGLDAERGDVLQIEGRIVNGSLEAQAVTISASEAGLLDRWGRTLRRAALGRLEPLADGRALLAGFLIGDTSGIDPADVEAMRRSGLSHFVAVSGSNVALFLLLLAFVAGPLALGPRRRAVVGLLGLPIYAAVTAFEPSVLRASVMAALALGGRLMGLVLEAWQLLATAVVLLILFDPGLIDSVGFQLSVAATAGVIVGSRWPAATPVSRALAVTVGAQIAVAPLLLLHFETVPLMSPLANLVAAPLVGLATALGSIGLLFPPLVVAGSHVAEVILGIARLASGWPQLGLQGVLLTLVVAAPALWSRSVRPFFVATAAFVLVVVVVPGQGPPPGSAVVLDVGQGDAILLHGGDGRFGLVDGGPDPVALEQKLRSYGVSSLEFVILTHVHSDHSAGLEGLVDRIPMGRVFADLEPHESGAALRFVDAAAELGVPVSEVGPGRQLEFGDLDLRFEGPLRRYASPNDQSIVVTVVGSKRTMLLSGDIETVAQGELTHLRADVLKVPHQGAGTSTPDWLTGVGADLAVISVGPNQFGHPVQWVIDVLEISGADVLRTDIDGDVVVDLS